MKKFLLISVVILLVVVGVANANVQPTITTQELQPTIAAQELQQATKQVQPTVNPQVTINGNQLQGQ